MSTKMVFSASGKFGRDMCGEGSRGWRWSKPRNSGGSQGGSHAVGAQWGLELGPIPEKWELKGRVGAERWGLEGWGSQHAALFVPSLHLHDVFFLSLSLSHLVFTWSCGSKSRPWPTQILHLGFSGVFIYVRAPAAHKPSSGAPAARAAVIFAPSLLKKKTESGVVSLKRSRSASPDASVAAEIKDIDPSSEFACALVAWRELWKKRESQRPGNLRGTERQKVTAQHKCLAGRSTANAFPRSWVHAHACRSSPLGEAVQIQEVVAEAADRLFLDHMTFGHLGVGPN